MSTRYDKKCCAEFTDLLAQIEKRSHALDAAESQYFQALGESLGDLQDLARRILEDVRSGEGKWSFSLAKTVADSTAQLTMLVVNAGIGEIHEAMAGSNEALYQVFEAVREGTQANVQKAIERAAEGLPEPQSSFLKKDWRRLIERRRALVKNEEKIWDALERLQAMAETLQRCFHCAEVRSIVPSEEQSQVDPKHANNKAFHNIKADADNHTLPPCDICQSIQGLLNYIHGRAYIIRRRQACYEAALKNAKQLNGIVLEMFKLVNRDLWDETTAGRWADVITSGLAATTFWGGVAKIVGEQVANYFQKSKTGEALESLRQDMQRIAKFNMDLERWAHEDWPYLEKGLDWELWRLTRYRYGKCPHPCEEEEKETPSEAPEQRQPPAHEPSPEVMRDRPDWGQQMLAFARGLLLRLGGWSWKLIPVGLVILLALLGVWRIWFGGGEGNDQAVVPTSTQGTEQPVSCTLGPGPHVRCGPGVLGGNFVVYGSDGSVIQEQPFEDPVDIPVDPIIMKFVKENLGDMALWGEEALLGKKALEEALKQLTLAVTSPQGETIYSCGLGWAPQGERITFSMECQGDSGQTTRDEVVVSVSPVVIECDWPLGTWWPPTNPEGSCFINTGGSWQVVFNDTLFGMGFVPEGGAFMIPIPDDLGPGAHRWVVEVQDLWGRSDGAEGQVFFVPGTGDPFDDPVVCGSGEPFSGDAPLDAPRDILGVVSFTTSSGEVRFYIWLNGALPDGGYWFGGVAPQDDPLFEPVFGITADPNRVETSLPGSQAYWLTDRWMALILPPGSLPPGPVVVFSEPAGGDGPCDLAGPVDPFSILDVDEDSLDVFPNLILPDPRGDTFDRNTGEPFPNPVSDITSVGLQQKGNQLIVTVSTNGPLPDPTRWSGAVEIVLNNQRCLNQLHNGKETREGDVIPGEDGRTTTCVFDMPPSHDEWYPIDMVVNTYEMQSPNSVWNGDRLRLHLNDATDAMWIEILPDLSKEWP